MERFYSKSNPEVLTHLVYLVSDFRGRVNLVSPDEFLQVSSIELSEKEEFRAHIHIWKDLADDKTVAQEAWVVVKGSVTAFLYDEDQHLVGECVLNTGDCCVTLHGGHKYRANEAALVYEFKSGPYLGDAHDKYYLPIEHTE